MSVEPHAPWRAALVVSPLLALLSGASVLHAQGLTRPKSVPIQSHIVVTEPVPATDERIAELKLPAGFHIARWADGLESPRVLTAAPNGDVYAASREAGTAAACSCSFTPARCSPRPTAAMPS